MELKGSHKRTEVGVIPNEWDVKQMGSLTSLMTNGFVGTVTNDYVDSEDGVLYVQGYNVEENGFNFHGIKRVSKAFHARNQKSCLRAGDLLTIQTGDIGVTTIVPPSLSGSNCHALVISRFNQRVADPRFYCQYFNSERGRIAFREIETGSTMKHLNVGDMVNLFVPTPPLPEQSAIAAALFDADALILKLDQLIAKKRDLKHGAMQGLLAGKQRLPGFIVKWDAKPFAEVLSRVNAKNCQIQTSDYQPSGAHPVVDQGKDLVVGYSDKDDKCFRCPKGGVIVFGDHTCIVKFINFDFVVGADGTQILAAKDGHLAQFVAYQLEYSPIQPTGYNRHFKFLKDRTFATPALVEQVAIAKVLSDMDTEITALEALRVKTSALKQGLMQELLTGRIRLV